MNERRVVDPKTGGEKGSKLARFDLIPQDALWEVAEHYGRGARKYADRNWEKGYAWSLSIAALLRHLSAFIQRNDYDDDPSLYEDGEDVSALHITAVLWHALALTTFQLRGIGTDDRPGGQTREEFLAEMEAEAARIMEVGDLTFTDEPRKARLLSETTWGGTDTQHDMLEERSDDRKVDDLGTNWTRRGW